MGSFFRTTTFHTPFNYGINAITFCSCYCWYCINWKVNRLNGIRGRDIGQHKIILDMRLIEAETKWPTFRRRHFQMHFLEWKYMSFTWYSLKFVPKGRIHIIPATLGQIMVRRRPCDKPLFVPMIVSLLTHICVTRPQWVNHENALRGWLILKTRERVLNLWATTADIQKQMFTVY